MTTEPPAEDNTEASQTRSEADPNSSATPTPEEGISSTDESSTGVPATAQPATTRPLGRRVPLTLGRVAVALVSVAALAATGLLWNFRSGLTQNTNTTDVLGGDILGGDVVGEATPRPAPPADDGADDILIVGSDTRTDAQGNPLPSRVLKELRTEEADGVNTDTIILLRIPHSGVKPSLVSIPRDTYVDIPGYRQDKINAAYGATRYRAQQQLAASGERDRTKINQEADRLGRSALVQSVQNITGVRIDHYAEVNLYGFYLLSEAIGGVEVCLNHATSDPDSGASFRKGKQTVAGGDALAFVRQRENLPRGDLDRIVRQQVFLSSAMRQLLSAGTLTDQAKLSGLLDVVRKSVVVDPNTNILDLARNLSMIASGQVNFVTIPVTAVGARNERGQSIITIDVPQVKAFVSGLVSAGPAAPSRFGGQPMLRLDGAPRQAQSPTAVDGVPCVD